MPREAEENQPYLSAHDAGGFRPPLPGKKPWRFAGGCPGLFNAVCPGMAPGDPTGPQGIAFSATHPVANRGVCLLVLPLVIGATLGESSQAGASPPADPASVQS